MPASHYPKHRYLISVRKTVWLGDEEQSKKGFRESEQRQTRLKGLAQKTWQRQYVLTKLWIKKIIAVVTCSSVRKDLRILPNGQCLTNVETFQSNE